MTTQQKPVNKAKDFLNKNFDSKIKIPKPISNQPVVKKDIQEYEDSEDVKTPGEVLDDFLMIITDEIDTANDTISDFNTKFSEQQKEILTLTETVSKLLAKVNKLETTILNTNKELSLIKNSNFVEPVKVKPDYSWTKETEYVQDSIDSGDDILDSKF